MAEHDHGHHHRSGRRAGVGPDALIGAAHAAAVGPAFSLLRLSLKARLAIAVGLTALVWIAVYWAET
ncbi:MAG: hypothetical protein P4L98_23780 [Ancalomicrobiaceae bacterium]|nr:hypothetical protein [Ancalomicrobiaceae bacterium]